MEEQLTYESAAKELEEILEQLKDDQVSIDSLAEKVERASVLLKFCNEKLKNTEAKVKDIVEKLGL